MTRRPGVILDGDSLTVDQAEAVARHGAPVTLSPRARERMLASRQFVEDTLSSDTLVYGINTGVGRFKDTRISPDDIGEQQRNLIASHSAGIGPSLPPDASRAMVVLRANALAKGYSGVRPLIVEALLDLLNHGVTPVIPAQGSVGASGDLAPLAHLALTLTGGGEAWYGGQRMAGALALAEAGLSPVILTAKEGLALINGTQLMTGLGALALADCRRLLIAADIAGAMTVEAIFGSDRPFHALLQAVRPHPGQMATAVNLRTLLAGSPIVASHHDCGKVQDPYSLRCIPQVHGAVKDAARFTAGVVRIEMNAATDNPLIFPEEREVISGGNFHGAPVALALDVLKLAVTTLGTMAERRIDRLMWSVEDGLPRFLSPQGGLHSGLMLAQYTAAALASENKVLAHPASADTIPTSAGQEDHVSMGPIAARHLTEVVRHTTAIVGIELVCAAQALELRAPLRPAAGTAAALAAVRRVVAPLIGDRVLSPDFEAAARLVQSGDLLLAVEAAVGTLAAWEGSS